MPETTGSLTSKAYLTLCAKALRMGTKTIVQLVTTPLVVRYLGPDLFGAWSMIQKLGIYLSATDFRAAGAAKLLLAVRSHLDDASGHRRLVGAALVMWLVFLPLALATTAVVLALSPRLIPTAPEYQAFVRWAVAIFAISVLLGRVMALPANVLSALNLEYKAMFWEAFVPVLAGGLTVAALLFGWSLPGIVLAYTAGVIVDGIVRHIIARRNVPWYGAQRPTRQDMRSVLSLTGWLQGTNFAYFALTGADVLIIGMILGSAAAGVFAATTYMHRLASEVLSMILASGRPGLINLCGSGEWRRVADLRVEFHVLAIGLGAVAGAGLLTVGADFVTLWLGADYYAGNVVNGLMVLVTIGLVLLRNETGVLDGLMKVRAKTNAMVASALVTVGASLVLVRVAGSAGMATAVLLGQSLGVTLCFASAERHPALAGGGTWRRLMRPILGAVVILSLAAVAGSMFECQGWFALVGAAILAVTVAAMLAWTLILGRDQRRLLRARITSVLRSVRRPA